MNTRITPYMDMIVLAAGQSRRFAASARNIAAPDTLKQFIKIDEKTIIEHCIESFLKWRHLGKIILVLPPFPLAPDDADLIARLQEQHSDCLYIATGGDERHQSVLAGLTALSALSPASEFVGIHDCARPFVPSDMLDRLLHTLTSDKAEASLPVLPVTDTIKIRNPQDETNLGTLDRSRLVRAQTPQCFTTASILKAHQIYEAGKLTSQNTDDCALIEATGGRIACVDGDRQAEKITTIDDLYAISGAMMNTETRMGSGYDVHKFAPDTPGPVMICGVTIEHECGLLAHSDGDVGIHAACDALFGAMADGDIGSHFPPTDAQWKNKSSDHFLAYAMARLAERQASLVHLDITIICERPKIGPYRDAMRARMAEICTCDISRISVKATTSEQMGFIGRNEGLAAMAAATISYPPYRDPAQ